MENTVGGIKEMKSRLLADFPMLEHIRRFRPREFESLAMTVGRCADYGRRYVLPLALELDKKIKDEHDFFPWDLIRAGTSYKLLSLIIPKIVGGEGGLAVLFSLAMEELCSFCPGVGNIFGAHALGIAPLLVCGSITFWEKVLRKIVEEEKKGNPVLMAAAVTEPSAGTDVEEPNFLRTARLSMNAKKVRGGYILNGRKCFISNGSVAKYTVLCCATDSARPLETWTTFLIDKDMEGFSVPRVEVKMGQRACPAAELLFENCFVPEENVLSFEGMGMQPGTLLLLAASRAPVGAIATGIARGAYEWFLKWANRSRYGTRPVEKQRIQMALADMKTRIQVSRWTYMNAAMSFDLSMGRAMSSPILRSLGFIPQSVRTSGKYLDFFNSKKGKRLSGSILTFYAREDEITRALAYASMAKAVGGDTAVYVTSLALEHLGSEVCEEREWIEKAFRDAKLTQIYEGTNQLNMLTFFNTEIQKSLKIEMKRLKRR